MASCGIGIVEKSLLAEQRELAQNLVILRALFFDAAQQFGAGALQRPAREVMVYVVAQQREIGLRQFATQRDDAVAHHAVARRHNHQDAAIGERHQFDMFQFLR